MSDLMLAYSVVDTEYQSSPGQGEILRNEYIIRPAPWGVFPIERPLYFYFETYNLRADADARAQYRIEAVLVEEQEGGLDGLIRRAFGRREDGVSLSFDETADQADIGRYLILNVGDQEPGTYVLAVRVTDLVREETVEKSRTIILE